MRRLSKAKKHTHQRKTFMMDGQTLKDLEFIKKTLRATSLSEAVRYSVRKVRELMDVVETGGFVYTQCSDSEIMVDIPKIQK